jgi:hypothetical protein
MIYINEADLENSLKQNSKLLANLKIEDDLLKLNPSYKTNFDINQLINFIDSFVRKLGYTLDVQTFTKWVNTEYNIEMKKAYLISAN